MSKSEFQISWYSWYPAHLHCTYQDYLEAEHTKWCLKFRGTGGATLLAQNGKKKIFIAFRFLENVFGNLGRDFPIWRMRGVPPVAFPPYHDTLGWFWSFNGASFKAKLSNRESFRTEAHCLFIDSKSISLTIREFCIIEKFENENLISCRK